MLNFRDQRHVKSCSVCNAEKPQGTIGYQANDAQESPLPVSNPDAAIDVAIASPNDIEAQPHRLAPCSDDVTPTQISRSNRRGLLASLTIIAEVENARQYPRPIKWFITFVISIAAIAAPAGSSIFYPALVEVSEDLHSTPVITNLSVAMYLLSMAIFPLWWSSFSESQGRRSIYIVSFALSILCNSLAALSKNIAMLIVMRVLSGGAAASVQAVGAGTIADIWESKERGTAMGMFYLGPLTGPLVAPIIGGALASRWGWRSTQWFMAIYGFVVLIFLIFALPETLPKLVLAIDEQVSPEKNEHDNLARTNSQQVAQEKVKRSVKLLKRTFLDPLKVILYLRYPAVLITVYYASIAYGSLFLLNISVQATFVAAPYNFSTLEVGLSYLPNSIGYIIASVIGGRWMDKIMCREAVRIKRYDENGRLEYRPEDRMRENAWIAAFMFSSALIWYGWTTERGVFCAAPLFAGFFFGVGSMIIFAASTTMLTEFMPKRASSGVALNNLARGTLACVGSIVAQPLMDAMGNGWLFTGLGAITAASSVVIWSLRHYGPRWRETMQKSDYEGF